MIRYTIMKRLTQILASIVFIITVLTVYFAFDFAVNTAVSNRYSTDKHFHREHAHDDMNSKHTSSDLFLAKLKKSQQTYKSNQSLVNQERRTRSIKHKTQRVKPAQFHKSKTGVKMHQMKRIIQEQRKHFSTNKITPHRNMKTPHP